MMLSLITECLPQVFVIILAVTGICGDAMVRKGAERAAAFVKDGGGEPEPVMRMTKAVGAALLAFSSFVGTLCALLLDVILSLAGDTPFGILYVVIGCVALVFLLVFLQLQSSASTHEVGMTKLAKPWRNSANQYFEISAAKVINWMTVVLMVLSLAVGAAKVITSISSTSAPSQAKVQIADVLRS